MSKLKRIWVDDRPHGKKWTRLAHADHLRLAAARGEGSATLHVPVGAVVAMLRALPFQESASGEEAERTVDRDELLALAHKLESTE